ncbi:hypothetical protein ACPF8X_05545 [Streptomyces sp. G35A]
MCSTARPWLAGELPVDQVVQVQPGPGGQRVGGGKSDQDRLGQQRLAGQAAFVEERGSAHRPAAEPPALADADHGS